MDETWRLIHLVAAAFWLGGMTLLAVIAVIAARTLDTPTFRTLMARAGQVFAAGSLVAWLLIAVSGAAMAWPRLDYTVTSLSSTAFGVVSFGFQFLFLCFALQPPNTFAFGSGLSSASVHAAIDANTPACTGFTNEPFDPFTADLVWTATGPLASIHNSAISDCGAFHQVLLSNDSNNPATASGTVSLFPDGFASTQASINSSERRFEDTGAAPQGCILRP